MITDQETHGHAQAGAPGPAELIEQCGLSFDRVAGLTKAHNSEWLSLDRGMGELKAVMVLAKQQLTDGGLGRAEDRCQARTEAGREGAGKARRSQGR